MGKLTGQSITLYEKTATGKNRLNEPIYTETPVIVENVLIGEPSTDDITTSVSMYGKKISYMLGIPKGDTHDWKDVKIEFTDFQGNIHKCKSFGFPITGIEANCPVQIPWLLKVRVEEYG